MAEAYRTVRRELVAYGSGLAEKSEIVALNKCDALDGAAIDERRAELEQASGREVLALSGVSGLGRDAALKKLHGEIRRLRAGQADSARTVAGGRL